MPHLFKPKFSEFQKTLRQTPLNGEKQRFSDIFDCCEASKKQDNCKIFRPSINKERGDF